MDGIFAERKCYLTLLAGQRLLISLKIRDDELVSRIDIAEVSGCNLNPYLYLSEWCEYDEDAARLWKLADAWFAVPHPEFEHFVGTALTTSCDGLDPIEALRVSLEAWAGGFYDILLVGDSSEFEW
jgi:hypothetical protein